jgi:hypothetical protein
LIRADFALENRPGGGRLACKRWRRLFADALPGLMGCARRCPKAVVRLHEGEGEANYTGWLRIPVERRPSRKRLRALKAKLRTRLEAGLLPVDGRVLKVGVRRHGASVPGPTILAMSGAAVPVQAELFDTVVAGQDEAVSEERLVQ